MESAVFKLLLFSALIGTWASTGMNMKKKRMKNTRSIHLEIIKSVSHTLKYKPAAAIREKTAKGACISDHPGKEQYNNDSNILDLNRGSSFREIYHDWE